MKRTLSLLALIVLVLTMAILPASAADLDLTNRVNVCLDAKIFSYYDYCAPTIAIIGAELHPVSVIFDGIITRGPDDPAEQNFCDFAMVTKAWTDMVENGTRYNLDGEADPQGEYLTYVDFSLGSIFTVDALRVFLDEAIDGKANNLLVDGFDILVRETENSPWTTVYSVTELYCKNKYKVHTEDRTGLQTCYVEAEFAPVKAQFIRFALTQPRCEKAPEAYAYPHIASKYFRITEIELYADRSTLPETTRAPVTTKSPVTTAAPETTRAPEPAGTPPAEAEGGLSISGMIIGLGVLLVVSAVAVKVVMFIKK